jgi:hypothetical protein
MIINDPYVCGTIFGPEKTNTILIVDPDTVLSFSIADECLKPIAWWDSKFI